MGRDRQYVGRARLRGAAAGFALAAGLGLFAGPGAAVPITPSDFGAVYGVESFEGLQPGPDVGVQPGFDGVYLPGMLGDYTFASGVTLVGPNVSIFPGDAFVHDFRSGAPPPNDWGAHGRIDGPEDVLDGTAYIAIFEAGTNLAAMEFRFDDPQLRVGAFVTGDVGTSITLEAYDANGVLLESITVSAVPVDEWSGNFIGLERSEGIASVVFRGHDFGLDALTFEPIVLVPEPSTFALTALALAALAATRRRT